MGCARREMVHDALLKSFVVDASPMQKYDRWLLDSFVEGQRNIKWCPKAGCTNAVSYLAGGTKSIQCKCGHLFCYSRLEEAHSPAACDLAHKWLQREKSEDATEIW
jgi:ariadne-1